MFTQNMLNYIDYSKYSGWESDQNFGSKSYTFKRTDGVTQQRTLRYIDKIPILTQAPYINSTRINPLANNVQYDIYTFINFDSSNELATINDFKAIEPIENITLISQTIGDVNNDTKYFYTFKNNNNTDITINSVEIFGTAEKERLSDDYKSMPSFLLYREVFDAPLIVPAQGVFLYTMEITTGDTTGTTGGTNA